MSQSDRTDLSRQWLRWADEDLTLAEHIASDPVVVARGACVWAHQSAEKAMKALLIWHDIDPPKLHDLDRLTQRMPYGLGSEFDAINLPELSRWSIESRYPANMDEATHADALIAITIAGQILSVVRYRINVM